MGKITLEKLIYKNYLKTSLASILFIELVLVAIYFIVNNNLINKSIDFILTDLKQNTYKLVDERTKSIDRKLTEVELLAKVLQKEHQNFFEYPQSYNQIEKPKFQYASNQMYYKTNNNGGSSVVVSKDTLIDEVLKKELTNSELFDSTFKTLVEHDENIVAVYFNSYKNYSRYYPYMDNFHEVFPPSINMQAYNFYYEADEKNNPNKNVVMTDVYLDPAHKGWMLSVIVPIYNQNRLEGVTGIDITLKKFIDNYLNINLPFNGKSFIINNSGKIIAMSKEVEDILNIKELEEYVYKKDEKINETINKSNKFNILDYKDKEIANNFKNIIENKSYSHKIKVNNQNYLLFTHKMEKTSWYVVSLIKEEDALKEVRSLENYYDNLGYVIIIIIFIFYAIFFFFLQIKAKNFVSQINTPLLEIIKLTKNIGKSRETKSLKSNDIVEIDELNNNFNSLISELNIRTNHLIVEETKRAYQEKLANTDTLTGAYNRRYLKEFSTDYLKIVKREKKDLSLLILDLDDFKNINDTYGHEAGDLVLIEFVKLARKSIRDNDLIVRFGGDEFIVLLPNTNISNAKILANKIINKISEYNMNKQVKFSISIGVSQYEEKDNSIESLILRADDSLYEAKRKGKNCVI
jgi:diguanylate cyclase (GGDEF)-like protein